MALSVLLYPPTLEAQNKSKKSKKQPELTTQAPKKQSKFKTYREVIPSNAVTDQGLFKVHKVDAKYYFEVPNSLLNKDMLLVSRYAKLPADLGGGYVNAGSKTNEQLIVWERFQDKILIKVKNYSAVSNDSLPIHLSVKSNNYEPTLFAFDIATFSPDSSATVIDVTKFYGTDVKAISGLSASMRTTYKVRNLDDSRSFITSMKSFPQNIEVIQDFTFNATSPPSNADTETISIQMNQSMILLPENPMTPVFMTPALDGLQ